MTEVGQESNGLYNEKRKKMGGEGEGEKKKADWRDGLMEWAEKVHFR